MLTIKMGSCLFSADSDAILTKGIISLLLQVYNDQTPDNILSAEPYFIDEIGLKEHLSPNTSKWAFVHGKTDQASCPGL